MDVAQIADRLSVAGCLFPDEEARELLASAEGDETLEEWVRRRERGEPLAWIVGATTFCDRRVLVDRGVYVPRPQTEALARRAADLLAPNGCAADLCTGSGAIALHLMHRCPAARVVATEIDPFAVECARRNGVVVVRTDLGGALRDRSFDVVTAVAPYVPTDEIRFLPADIPRYEPRLALDGGADGLDLVRGVVGYAGRLLRSGGWLLTEVGGHQDVALESVLAVNGFTRVERWFDVEGDLRGICVRRR